MCWISVTTSILLVLIGFPSVPAPTPLLRGIQVLRSKLFVGLVEILTPLVLWGALLEGSLFLVLFAGVHLGVGKVVIFQRRVHI